MRRARTAKLFLLLALYAGAAVLAPAATAQEASVRPLDLQELTALAEHHSYGLKAGEHAVSAAIAQLDEARISPFFQFRARGGLAWVPDANGVSGYTPDSYNQLNRAFGPGLTGSIEGALPLWTFGKISAARDAAHAGVRAAELNRELTRAEVRFNVRRAYFGLALALDAKQMISEGLPKLQQALEQLDERLKNREPDADATERYRMSTTLAEIKARSAEVQHLESVSLTALKALTGLANVEIPACPLTPLPFVPKSAREYQELARKSQPMLRLLEAAQTARHAELDATSARFFPDLALGLSVESQYVPGRTPYAFYTPLTLGAAIVAKWDLDLAGNYFRTERARHKLLEVHEQRSLAAEASDVNIAEKHAAVIDASERVQAWESGHRDARRWFVTAAQSYQLGLITVRELIEGVSAYFKARFAHLQSMYDLNTSVSGLEQAVGTSLLPDAAFRQRCDEDPDED